jgi:phosphopantetheinyl transferase (holo-ACP synthase)
VIATGAAPEIRLSGLARERAESLAGTVRISLTHTDRTAGAVAFVEGGR